MKSSYSQETNCVDVRPARTGGVWLRETTASRGVHIPADSWAAFVAGVKAGEFDHLGQPDDEPEPDDERAAYIRGLRNLAGLLAANPSLALPYPGHGSDLTVILVADPDQREQLAAWVRHMDSGVKTKQVTDTAYRVRGTVGGLPVVVIADRDEVCQRVLVGTREVVRQVPHPDAPMVTVIEVVEDVEWVCSPLLADQNVGTPQ